MEEFFYHVIIKFPTIITSKFTYISLETILNFICIQPEQPTDLSLCFSHQPKDNGEPIMRLFTVE